MVICLEIGCANAKMGEFEVKLTKGRETGERNYTN